MNTQTAAKYRYEYRDANGSVVRYFFTHRRLNRAEKARRACSLELVEVRL